MNNLEPYRPCFHFTPRSGWMNDPNGLVYFNGWWHMFYQYFNHEEIDGMQWGHAVSRDLIQWEHLPPAIPPDCIGHIWSGSAVVDHKDSSGLFGGKAGLVCLFTYWNPADHRQCQGMAFSADGRNFTTYNRNPVIPELRHLPGHGDDKDFRDPKVFWHEPTGRWIMVAAGGKLRIFSSKNLIDWKFESVNEPIWTECPDLFELPVDGDMAGGRWVLSGGGRWYMLGWFDGRQFTPESEALTMAYGPDCYAAQTWSDAPDGRRIGIAWLNRWAYECGAQPGPRIENKFPTSWAGGCMTMPYELTLRTTGDGVRLFQLPVREFDAIGRQKTARQVDIKPGQAVSLPPLSQGVIDMDVTLRSDKGSAGIFELGIPSGDGGQFTLSADAGRGQLNLDRSKAGYGSIPKFAERYEAPLPLQPDSSVKLRIIIDRCSIEIFAGDGLVQFSAIILPDAKAGISLKSQCPASCRHFSFR